MTGRMFPDELKFILVPYPDIEREIFTGEEHMRI
jgi:hypothetical protein